MRKNILTKMAAFLEGKKEIVPIQNSSVFIEPEQEIDRHVSEFQKFFHLRQRIEEQKIYADKITELKAKINKSVYGVWTILLVGMLMYTAVTPQRRAELHLILIKLGLKLHYSAATPRQRMMILLSSLRTAAQYPYMIDINFVLSAMQKFQQTLQDFHEFEMQSGPLDEILKLLVVIVTQTETSFYPHVRRFTLKEFSNILQIIHASRNVISLSKESYSLLFQTALMMLRQDMEIKYQIWPLFTLYTVIQQDPSSITKEFIETIYGATARALTLSEKQLFFEGNEPEIRLFFSLNSKIFECINQAEVLNNLKQKNTLIISPDIKAFLTKDQESLFLTLK